VKCGFCGTDVPDGYTVCTGCHAKYRVSGIYGIPAVLSMFLGFMIFVMSYAFFNEGGFRYGMPVLITGILLFLLGRKGLKRISKNPHRYSAWYRQ